MKQLKEEEEDAKDAPRRGSETGEQKPQKLAGSIYQGRQPSSASASVVDQ